MNKKLEEYREKYFNNLVKEAFGTEPPKKLFDKEESLLYDFLKEGFDAAIALDLPVKFAEWILENAYNMTKDGKWRLNESHHPKMMGQYTTSELFQYYIDNVHKFE